VLPVVVDTATHARLFELVAADPDAQLTVDLSEEGILLPDGTTIDFTIDPFAKRMLLAGTDEIGYVMDKLGEIQAWEAGHASRGGHAARDPAGGRAAPGSLTARSSRRRRAAAEWSPGHLPRLSRTLGRTPPALLRAGRAVRTGSRGRAREERETVAYQRRALAGFRTQWFSSGK